MKPRVMAAFDAILLRKRSIIETINDQLKNIFQLEHSRHRSLTNYMGQCSRLLGCLFIPRKKACSQPKKRRFIAFAIIPYPELRLT
ncbi:hypothetical protein BMR07_16725 [Methylococcaceae bacterium CS1]|nr:hypothetical protein BMR07_16725 [Methylococcaceae bacterium CS1]